MPVAISCDSAQLTKDAACFDCIPKKMRGAVELFLLATLAGGSMDPATLVQEAKCFSCIPPGAQGWVRNYLLCQIATAVGA